VDETTILINLPELDEHKTFQITINWSLRLMSSTIHSHTDACRFERICWKFH